MNEVSIEKIKVRISKEMKNPNDIVVESTLDINVVDPADLSKEELLVAIIFAYNTLTGDSDLYYPITKKRINTYLNWSNYKIQKTVKAIPLIIVMPMFDDEGLLRGKGYVINSLISN